MKSNEMGIPFWRSFVACKSRIDRDHPILATVNQFFRFFFQYWCILQLELFATFFMVIDRYKVLSIKFSSSQSILMAESSCSRYVRNSIRHYVVVFWNVSFIFKVSIGLPFIYVPYQVRRISKRTWITKLQNFET